MLTSERLRELLDYDPTTGTFVWKVGRRGHAAGRVAGRIIARNGYHEIKIDQQYYRGHRLAWLYVYGEWPQGLDHVNRVRTDNRIDNLRLATQSQNNANRAMPRHNTSGYKGVSYKARKWEASIAVRGRTIYLGRFGSALEASAVYQEAAAAYFGDFANG
jgi:hypothetical protein